MTDVSAASNIQAADISPEEQNYLRIANLLLRVAPSSVRIKFDNELHPGGLNTVLNQNRFKILEPLKQKRIINQAQWDLLFPISGTPSSKTFDLTLMICLIRNLTNIEIGDAIPFSGNKTDGADLTRIKYYRNEIMHSIDGILSESNFKIWWDEISEAIIRLGGVNFKDHCILMKLRKLDRNDKEILTEIKNIIGTSDPIPKGLRKLWDKTILEWKKEQVAETRAIIQLAKMIASDNVAVAVGPSGCGKSTAIHYIALHLASMHNFDIIIAYNPEDMRQLFNPERKQVFVIDDILGVATFDENRARKWIEMSNDVKRILDGDQVKLLASCKSHIFQHRIVQTIEVLSNFSCDFISKEYSLTDDERQCIANFYLTNDEIVLLKSSEAFSTFNFFPVLCQLYAKHKSNNIVDFFTNPLQAVQEDLYLLLIASDQTTFATLFLFVVYNNCIMESILRDELKMKTVLEDISGHFDLRSKFSIQVVKNEMKKLRNSYLKKQNTTYTIIHDKIFDILVYFCGKHMFDFMLDVAHTDIIRDRFIIKRSLGENKKHENGVEITVEKEMKYLERLKKDSEQGFILNVFSNRNLNDTIFRSKLTTLIGYGVTDSLSDQMALSLLVSLMDRGFCDIVLMMLPKEIHLDQRHWDGETLLFKAAQRGFTDVVKLFLERNANPNYHACLSWLDRIEKMYPGTTVNSIYDNNKTCYRYYPPPLPSYQIDEECTERRHHSVPIYTAVDNSVKSYLHSYLCHRKCRYEPFKTHQISPLHIAANKGFIDIVKLLLIHGAELDCITECHQIASPLYIAVNQGYTDIVKVFLENKPYPNGLEAQMQTVNLKEFSQSNFDCCLHVAVKKGYHEIVKLLLHHQNNQNQHQHQDFLLPITLSDKLKLNFYWKMIAFAIISGHGEIVKLLLEQRYEANVSNEKCVSPLLVSICEGRTEIVRLLLEHNFDPNICYKNKESPLYRATSLGHIAIVKVLLEYNSNPNICNKDRKSPLYIATWEGNIEIVKLLLKQNCDPNICDNRKQSVLHVAAYKGRTEIVEILLQHKVRIDISNFDKQTPLYIAARECNIRIVNLLLKHKCDPNICNFNNESPIFVASDHDPCFLDKNKNASIMDKIYPLLLVASQTDYTGIVNLLLDHYCDPNVCNKDNTSPLFAASSGGKFEIVKLLLDNNCDPNVCNKYNESPLFAASLRGHFEIVKFLLDNNCDPNVCNTDNKSPLLAASLGGNFEIVKLLLDHNCDPNVCNKDNTSPLFAASLRGKFEIVKLLLDNNCDPNVCNKDNESPLFAASFRGNFEIVKLLLDHNCDPNVCNKDNETPLLVASREGYADIVKLFLDHDCDPNVCTKDNTSPLFIASSRGHTEIVKLILNYDGDSYICNKDNESSLSVASKKGHTEIGKLLMLNHKSDPSVSNKDNASPCSVTSKNCHTEAVKLVSNYNCYPDICNNGAVCLTLLKLLVYFAIVFISILVMWTFPNCFSN